MLRNVSFSENIACVLNEWCLIHLFKKNSQRPQHIISSILKFGTISFSIFFFAVDTRRELKVFKNFCLNLVSIGFSILNFFTKYSKVCKESFWDSIKTRKKIISTSRCFWWVIRGYAKKRYTKTPVAWNGLN